MSRWTTITPWKPIPNSGQKVAFTGAAASSAAVGAQTRAILLAATQDCHIEIGPNPAAVATSCFIKGGAAPLPLACDPADKVSVVQDSVAGNLFITELTH